MPMDKSKYPPEWDKISLAIRERAGWCCEWCGAENGQPNPATGSTVVLTVAHLGTDHPDGQPGDKRNKLDVRPENLAALCQKCHLNYDRDEHTQTRAENRRRRQIEAGQLRLPLVSTG